MLSFSSLETHFLSLSSQLPASARAQSVSMPRIGPMTKKTNRYEARMIVAPIRGGDERNIRYNMLRRRKKWWEWRDLSLPGMYCPPRRKLVHPGGGAKSLSKLALLLLGEKTLWMVRLLLLVFRERSAPWLVGRTDDPPSPHMVQSYQTWLVWWQRRSNGLT